MKDFCITISPPRGSDVLVTGSPFHSDTLFGMFCQCYLTLFGEDALVERIIEPSRNQGVVTFSDGMPSGRVPRPILAPLDDERWIHVAQERGVEVSNRSKRMRFLQQVKKLKPLQYVQKAWLQGSDYAIDESAIASHLLDWLDREREQDKKPDSAHLLEPHNTLNRLTGTVEQAGGGFYHDRVTAYRGSLDLYVRVDDTMVSEDDLMKCMDLMSHIGFGKNRSTGKGQFKIADVKEVNLTGAGDRANAVMTLSHTVPGTSDRPLSYKLGTKFGKLAPQLVQQGLPPQKNPFVCVVPGSVFHKPDGYLLGRVLDNVMMAGDKIIIQNTCGIPLPIILKGPEA